MAESVTDGDSTPGGNIKNFIKQFDKQPIKLPTAAPTSKKPSGPTPAPNKPNIAVKPPHHPVSPAKNGLKSVKIVPNDIRSAIGTLKPVEPKVSESSSGGSNLSKGEAFVPPVLKKPWVNKENNPPVESKPPAENKPQVEKKPPVKQAVFPPSSSYGLQNGGGGVSIAELKKKLNKTQFEPNTVPPKKETQAKHEPPSVPQRKDKEAEPEFDDDKIYSSPDGLQYRALKMPSNVGPAPKKPPLPSTVDLYDFLVEEEDEDALYEAYNDTEVGPVGRAVSMIPDMNELEELGDAMLEEYTDTEAPPPKERPLSMQDGEVYEEFD